MRDLIDSSNALRDAAVQLDEISKALVQTELGIERLEPQIEEAIEDYIAGLWEEAQENGTRLPPEDVRKALAWKALDPELRRSYRAHLATRRRTKARLADLREVVAAHRSIVSAARAETEATEGPQPLWSPAYGG